MLLRSFPILFCTSELCSSVSNSINVIFESFIIRFRIILFTFEFCYLLSNSVLPRIIFSAATIIFILYLRIVLFLNVLCGPRFCFSWFELRSSKSGSLGSSAALVWGD